ncbi:hypothetical protein HNO52_04255 [Billgrantia diversa]|uniref:DUF6647 family protein n=1 Tax=Halomonas sp. MCCC 1A13316 TaxID=2733487 RepID=UPI0018A4FF15|nr:DUF6647 family protein [Halomonas sp. MCCC 1A13316]QOR37808.1 hypothetical protein HNO52_04255 [Halomonas sp. MCCC 1A13316]
MTMSLVVMMALAAGPCASAPVDAQEADRPGRFSQRSVAAQLETTISELSDWIIDHSDYRKAPNVIVTWEGQLSLQARCFPNFPSDLMPAILIKAAYDSSTSTIYVDTGFDPGDPIDISYLLHELVHHHQLRAAKNTTARHRGELEGEAYRLQLAWLSEQGYTDPYAELGIDEKTLLIIERCPR